MWSWAWNLQPGEYHQPFIGIWPRGSGKSTTSELITTALGARQTKKYCWYICETQAQADQHVESIASMIENPFVSYYYPLFAERRIGKYGNVRAWRRNRLRCGNGFTIDAMGLDSARRGSKVEEQRPDFMVFDDVDGKHDSINATEKKIATITTSILPAGSYDTTILAVQNLIIPDGMFSQLADGRADFLHDRHVSGPFPAVEGLKCELEDGKYIIKEGRATWEGQNLAICQQQIFSWGYSSFLKEANHDVEVNGGMFDHLEYEHCKPSELPTFVMKACCIDPSVTSTDRSDSNGIQIDGLAADGKIYRLYSWEEKSSPMATIARAILMCQKYDVHVIGIEANQGSDTWYSVFERACQHLEISEDEAPVIELIKASSSTGGKAERASQMLTDYEGGTIVHVEGTHKVLERALNRFPIAKPYDLVDSAYWSWSTLRNGASWLLD